MFDFGASDSSTDGTRKALRTLFIGLGGTGNEVIRRVKRDMVSHGFDLPVYQYLVMDTMPFHEDANMDPLKHLRNYDEYLYIGGYNPNQIIHNLENWPVIAHWWGNNRGETNLVTVDEGAGQMRAVGRMGFFRHFKDIRRRFEQMIHESTSIANREAALAQGFDVPTQRDPIVYVVFSLCGGTGSSLFFDVAYVLRQLFAPAHRPTIVGVAMLPGPYVQSIGSIPQHERIQANAYAALQELERLHNLALGQQPRHGPDLWNVQYASNFEVSSPDLPFDYLYLVDDTSITGERYSAPELFDLMSQSIFWLSGPSTSVHFWERAKNLISPTLAAGGAPDRSGQPRLAKYSSLGIAVAGIDWHSQQAREQGTIAKSLLTHLCSAPSTRTPPLPNTLTNAEMLLANTSQGFLPPDVRLSGSLRTRDAVREYLLSTAERYSALPIRRQPGKWADRLEQVKTNFHEELTRSIRTVLATDGPVAASVALVTIRHLLENAQNDLGTKMAQAANDEGTAKQDIDTIQRRVKVESPLLTMARNATQFVRKVFRPDSRAEEQTWTSLAKDGAQALHKLAVAQHRYQACEQISAQVVATSIARLDDFKEPVDRLKRELLAWRDHIDEEVRRQEEFEKQREEIRFEPVIRVPPAPEHESALDRMRRNGALSGDVLRGLLQKALEAVFGRWPDHAPTIEELRAAVGNVTIDLLKTYTTEQSILERLVSSDSASLRQRFLARASCLWSFQEDATQDVMQQIEHIAIVGVGEDIDHQGPRGQQARILLDRLLRDQDPHIERVSTGMRDEIALIKTMQGLQVTYLRGIAELQTAYQIMRVVRGAPYLHLDNTLWAEEGYGPLAEIVRTPAEIIRSLDDAAKDIRRTDYNLGDAVAQATLSYSSALVTYDDGTAQHRPIRLDEAITVNRINDPLFALVESLEQLTTNTQRTSGVRAVLMELVMLIELLHVQGWSRISPVVGDPFRADLHQREGAPERYQGLRPGCVAAVIHGGFQHRRQSDRPDVRPALVKVSA